MHILNSFCFFSLFFACKLVALTHDCCGRKAWSWKLERLGIVRKVPYDVLYFVQGWYSVEPDVFNMVRFGTGSDRIDNAAQLVGRMRNVIVGYTLLSRYIIPNANRRT